LLVELLVGGRDGVAFAGDLGGDALRQLTDRLLVDEQVRLRLAEHVNEAGRNDEPGSVDGALGGDVRISFANEGDAVADDADVCVNPGIAAAIHHAAVADQGVVLLGEERSSKRDEKGEQKLASRQRRLRGRYELNKLTRRAL